MPLDVEEFRRRGYEAVDKIADYYANLERYKGKTCSCVSPLYDPRESCKLILALLALPALPAPPGVQFYPWSSPDI